MSLPLTWSLFSLPISYTSGGTTGPEVVGKEGSWWGYGDSLRVDSCYTCHSSLLSLGKYIRIRNRLGRDSYSWTIITLITYLSPRSGSVYMMIVHITYFLSTYSASERHGKRHRAWCLDIGGGIWWILQYEMV